MSSEVAAGPERAWKAELVAASLCSFVLLGLPDGMLGLAGGGTDAALNTAVALARQVRLMNLLHASYGVGTSLGALVVTVALVATSTWRTAYAVLVVLVVLEVALVAIWLAVRSRFPPRLWSAGEPGGSADDSPASSDRWGRPIRTMLILSGGVFFASAALEATVASWAASYLRGPGGLSVALAGVAVFVYGTGFTLGRLTAAWMSGRHSPETIARAGAVASVAGAVVVWANADPAATVVALWVLGFSLGPVFPALMVLTPVRLGPGRTVHAVGWQLAAAAAGGIGVAAMVGVVLQVSGLSSFGPALTVIALGLACVVVLSEREAARGLAPTSPG